MTHKSEGFRKSVFYSIAAQADNLGDIEIRAAVLGWIIDSGSRAIVFTGAMPSDYVLAFPCSPSLVYVRNPLTFAFRLLAECIRGRGHIVFAPGPQRFRRSPKTVLRLLGNLLATSLIRLRGGEVIGVGRAYRGSDKLSVRLEQLILRRFTLMAVRDHVSRRVVGRELRLEPDVAFLQSSTASVGLGQSPRTYAAICLRGDREVSVDNARRVVEALTAIGLTPRLVTQVQRDERAHQALAIALGIEHVAWGTRTHAEQLTAVRAAYRQSALVISNRLHGILIGIQEGAAPYPITTGDDKLSESLFPWLPDTRVAADLSSFDFTSAYEQDQLARGVLRASQRLESLREEFEAALGSDRSTDSRTTHA